MKTALRECATKKHELAFLCVSVRGKILLFYAVELCVSEYSESIELYQTAKNERLIHKGMANQWFLSAMNFALLW